MPTPKRPPLRVEHLEDRNLLSTLVLEVEPNSRHSRSTPINFDTDGQAVLQGTSTSKKDKDFFSFTPTANTSLNVNLRTTNGVFAKLEIEDRADNDIFETEPNDGINSGSVNLTAGTTYFIRLRSPVKARAEYQVDLALGSGGSTGGGSTGGGTTAPAAEITESEPNGRKSQADSFELINGSVVQLQGASSSKRDKDFFLFTAPQNGTLRVDVHTLNAVFAKLEIEDTAEDDLFETEPNDGIHGGTVDLVAGQTYFIRLRSPIEAAAEYEVNLLFTGTGGGTSDGGGGGGGSQGTLFTESESNNDRASADAFQLTGAARLQGTSNNHDDKDYFVFTAAQSGTLNVRVTSTNGTFAQVEIEDGLGNDLFETEPNDGINSGTLAVTAGRSYFVRLRSRDDFAAAYDVELTLT